MSQAPATRHNGDSNKLLLTDRPAHAWYRFVLSFPPHLVREYISRFCLNQGQTLLDPFCGTGTVLVEARKRGIRSIGLEANPMAHFASATKVDWSLDPDELVQHSSKVAARARSALLASGFEDVSLLPQTNGSHDLRTLTPSETKLLLAGSISPLPLHKTLILRDAILEDTDQRFSAHQLLALANALIQRIGNLHFGPEVGVSPPKPDTPVIDPWLNAVYEIAEDLRVLHMAPSSQSEAILADARDIGRILDPSSVDAVITSPPYPNEKDYTRTTRLESVILGFFSELEHLRSLKKNLIRSNTRSVYKDDDDDLWIRGFSEIQKIAEEIEEKRITLGKTSGFERMYHRVTKLYFGGMARHLADLRGVLKPGAHLAYVVGDQASYLQVMIQTGRILGEIAESLGYEVVGIDLFRTRLATATKKQLREEVLLLKWPGN